VTVRSAGRASLIGLSRVSAAALVAAAGAAAVGRLLADAWDGGQVLLAVLQALSVGVVVLLVAGAIMMVLARGPSRAVLRGLRRPDTVQEEARSIS